MSEVTVTCDRCGGRFDGVLSGTPDDTICSGGFYLRLAQWKKYMTEDEFIICDECMWADPGYMHDYPKN